MLTLPFLFSRLRSAPCRHLLPWPFLRPTSTINSSVTHRSAPTPPRLQRHQTQAAPVAFNHRTPVNDDGVVHRNKILSSNQHRPSLFVRFGARGRMAARFLGDFTAASVASLLVSPFISIVDRAIIQSASGTLSMSASVQQGLRVMVTKPVLFLARPDFLCTFGLYGATCECPVRGYLACGVGEGWQELLALHVYTVLTFASGSEYTAYIFSLWIGSLQFVTPRFALLTDGCIEHKLQCTVIEGWSINTVPLCVFRT